MARFTALADPRSFRSASASWPKSAHSPPAKPYWRIAALFPVKTRKERRSKIHIGSLPAGKAVITTGGRLPAKYVIHTVGPVYRGGQQHEAETLASCYSESIRIADDHGMKSLAFPSISTGAFGYPVPEAAEIAVRTIVEVLPPCAHVEHIRFVLFDIATCKAYVRAAEKLSQQAIATSAIFEKGPS